MVTNIRLLNLLSKLNLRPSNLQLMPWNFQIQYSYLLINWQNIIMSHADRWHKQSDSGTKLTIISSAVLVYYLISKLWWIPSTLSNRTNTHDNVSRRLVLHRHPLPATLSDGVSRRLVLHRHPLPATLSDGVSRRLVLHRHPLPATLSDGVWMVWIKRIRQ